MIHKFLPHTSEDIQQMLERVGIKNLNELYAEVPESIRFKGDYDLPDTMSANSSRNSVKRTIN